MTSRTPAERAIRRHLVAGLTLVIVLAVGAGGWAATTPLSGAVIASGTLVVDSYVKKVQHPTGGIVGTLSVKNGAQVQAGEELIRLDQTQTRASLAIVEKRLIELQSREVRLNAEIAGEAELSFAAAFPDTLGETDVSRAVIGETELFRARRASRASQVSQLRERVSQLSEEISGLEAQIHGKDREIVLIEAELGGVRALLSKGLTQVTRVNSLEREAARLTGERGSLVSAIAQTRGRIVETNLQILQVNEDLQQEVAKELREIQGSIGEFAERRIAAQDQLQRVVIRAPQAGIVHELAVHTAGAVIAPGEAVMLIVPAADKLEAEIKVAPQDIDQLTIGQRVNLRFSAFNQTLTPEVSGTLERIGADLTREPQTGLSYYLGRVSVSETEVAKLGGLKLLPGMPVEAFLKTGDRTALSYLVKPLEDQIERSFRAD